MIREHQLCPTPGEAQKHQLLYSRSTMNTTAQKFLSLAALLLTVACGVTDAGPSDDTVVQELRSRYEKITSVGLNWKLTDEISFDSFKVIDRRVSGDKATIVALMTFSCKVDR